MPRKGEIRKREILPDSRYGDKLVAKFINTMMTAGKKSVLEGVFYGSLDLIAAKTKGDATSVSSPRILSDPGAGPGLQWNPKSHESHDTLRPADP